LISLVLILVFLFGEVFLDVKASFFIELYTLVCYYHHIGGNQMFYQSRSPLMILKDRVLRGGIKMKLSKPVMVVIWLILACLFSVPATNGAQSPALIPQPVSLEVGDGTFEIGPAARVVASDPAKAEAHNLIEALAPAMGYRLKLVEGGADRNAIVLSLDAVLKEQLGAEGYKLDVSPKRIDIRASEPAGLFYGCLLYTSPSPRDRTRSRMPSSA